MVGMDRYNSNESEGLFDHLQSAEIDVETLLEQSQKEQKERLESELSRIRQQLDRREEIHDTIVEDLEWRIEWYSDRLTSLYKTGRGRKEGTRERLKNRLESFYENLRNEYRTHWRDLQDLEQEKREVLRELEEIESDALENLVK